MESSQNLSVWATVDVPSSPMLSRLFEALQIECPMEIPPISIGSPVAESAQPYIEDINVGEASNEEQSNDAIEECPHGASFLPSCSSLVLRREDTFSSYPRWNLPNKSFDEWVLSQWDFSQGQPFNIEMNLGPMKPLSPFPKSPTAIARPTLGFRPPIAFDGRKDIEMQETLHKTRLRKLKRTLNGDDPRILGGMYSLANIYNKQSKYQQAERLLRHIAVETQKTYGFKHRQTLSIYLDVVGFLIAQGKLQNAAKIHRLVHPTIMSLFGLEDRLAVSSMISMSNIYYLLGRDEEADELYRQVLQIMLNTLGPRNADSLDSMKRLAVLLMDRGNCLPESEKLLSTVIQLQQEVEGISEENVCHSQVELADVLRLQGRYRESKEITLRTAERAEITLGPDGQQTLRINYHIAKCLDKLGQYVESERVLRKTLEQQLKRLGLSHHYTVDTMWSLASMVEKMDRYHEAVPLYEKCFRLDVKNYGWEHYRSVQACYKLGQCYEKLMRYGDAFGLYQRTVDQLRSQNASDHPAIVRISHWIAELRDTVARKRKDVSLEQDEMDVDKYLSNEGDPVGKEQAGGEGKLVKDDSAMIDEDWMKNFVNFQTPKEDTWESGHPDEHV
jgi:tetratricopeptide (TPR) repeat protein